MSVLLTIKCEGLRHGQPCRGHASAVPRDDLADQWHDVLDHTLDRMQRHGWRTLPNGGDLCPSRGHDDEPPAS